MIINTMPPLFTIYSKRLAGYLLFNGGNLLTIERSTVNPELHVYKFIKSGKLERLIKNYDSKRTEIKIQ